MPSSIALSGLNAAYRKLRTTANNIANVATPGFRQSRVDTVSAAAGGVKVAQVSPQLHQGAQIPTHSAFDLAVTGQGYFRLADNGSEVFSRSGAFQVDRDGFISNSSGQHLTGILPNGQTGALKVPVSGSQPIATSEVNVGLNLDANNSVPALPFNTNDPASYNNATSLTSYDSLGGEHQLDLYFSKTATPGQVEVRAYSDGNEVLSSTTLNFDSSGQLTTPLSGQLSIPPFNPGNGAADLNIKLDVKNVTQYGDEFQVQRLEQNGSSSAQLSGISISDDGQLSAQYANGEQQAVGQAVLANFPNAQGLSNQGNSSFAANQESGSPVYGLPQSGSLGGVQSGALEDSNVNLEEQFVNMKMAEREVQANAKVIMVEDELLGTLFNEKA